jgi:DNA-directed RNA polymerase specialized sigma24 family protein
MKEKTTFSNLVRQARQGGGGKMDELAAQAQPRINAFFLRTTLNPELTDDLTQDTLLTMIVQIPHLEKTESFWPWLYRIAWSKLQQHRRQQCNPLQARVRFFRAKQSLRQTIEV